MTLCWVRSRNWFDDRAAGLNPDNEAERCLGVYIGGRKKVGVADTPPRSKEVR
jgi:hypothetical protein